MTTPFSPDLIDIVRSADHIAVLTGAGVSAESGIPTFRDAMDGYWAKFDPEDLATVRAFEQDPKLVTQWYEERRLKVLSCQPNAGHLALAELERRCVEQGKTFTLITQNVDRLHQRAGSVNVLELHGTLLVWRCLDCARETNELGPPFTEIPNPCSCGGFKRPGVVWFGEPLPKAVLKTAQRAAESADIFFSVGTSSVVYPAAGLIDIACTAECPVLEINPLRTTYTTSSKWSLRGTSGELLPALVAATQ